MGYALGEGGVVTGGIRALNDFMPGEGSQIVGFNLLSVNYLPLLRKIRYVCRVGISNWVDLHLGAYGLSREFS